MDGPLKHRDAAWEAWQAIAVEGACGEEGVPESGAGESAPRAMAWDGRRLWLVGDDGLGSVQPPWESGIRGEAAAPGARLLRTGVLDLCLSPRWLWCALSVGLAVYDREGRAWRLVADTTAWDRGSPLVLRSSGADLWVGFEGGAIARRAAVVGSSEDATAWEVVWELDGPVRDLAPLGEGWLVAGDAGLYHCTPGTSPRRLGAAPARALLAEPSGWLVGTADGLVRVQSEARGAVSLVTAAGGAAAAADAGAPAAAAGRCPLGDVWRLARTAGGVLWAGGARGLARRDAAGWHYHQGPRWLPDDGVVGLTAVGEDAVAVLTAGGTVVLSPQPQTLVGKAAVLQARLQARHLRLGHFVEETIRPETAASWAGAVAAGPGRAAGVAAPGAGHVTTVSDNDGLWTGMYLAAQSYRYAVTGEAEARREADRSFAALQWLEAVTTIPGYPTKAIVAAADRPAGGRWYPSADGQWWWKGDCSSDEIVGHMYACSLYFDLAADAGGRQAVASHVARILRHIVDNGWQIMEFGQRTRWGFWNPEALNGAEGRWGDRALNALEILSHLRVAQHVTGDPAYARLFDTLAETHGYVDNLARTKHDRAGQVNHSDDELAFLAYDPLLRYETDAGLRGACLESLHRAWAFERPERNPLWNFIYAAHATAGRSGPAGPDAAPTSSGQDLALVVSDAVRTLREIPEDTVAWPVCNSWRRDVVLDPTPDRHGRLQATHVLPYDELAVTRWNGNPYAVDEGNGRIEGDGVHYLLPYWMGRFHGWIEG